MTDASTTQVQSWIERMNAGDAAAREALIRHTHDHLLRLTRRMLRGFHRVRSWEDTDDVLQNALVRLLRALRAAPPASSAEFFGLAARQVRRELLDLARHYFGPQGPARHLARGVPEGEELLAEGSPDHSHEPSRLATWTEFHEGVEALPARERAVFDLLWYHGLTQAEAAAVLGVSPATVKRWWLAARLALQETLSGNLLES